MAKKIQRRRMTAAKNVRRKALGGKVPSRSKVKQKIIAEDRSQVPYNQ
jgi:hypothetical protein